MELLLIVAAIVAVLASLNLTTLAFGADSRDGIGDDWSRPLAV